MFRVNPLSRKRPCKKRYWKEDRALNFHQALNNAAPSYMSELLKPYHPTANLRSGPRRLLVVLKSKLKSFRDRSFSFAGPKLWNTLSMNLRMAGSIQQFKSGLQTYLYNLDIWSLHIFVYIYLYDCMIISVFWSFHPSIFICCKVPWVVSSV